MMSRRKTLKTNVQLVMEKETVGRLLLKILNTIWCDPHVFFSLLAAYGICSFAEAVACDGMNLDKNSFGSSNPSLGLK